MSESAFRARVGRISTGNEFSPAIRRTKSVQWHRFACIRGMQRNTVLCTEGCGAIRVDVHAGANHSAEHLGKIIGYVGECVITAPEQPDRLPSAELHRRGRRRRVLPLHMELAADLD